MTLFAIKAKHWVLRHYLWVTIILLIVVLLVACWLKPQTCQEWLGILAAPFVFLVAIQKQKTAELVLFKELFTKFNKRFNKMNDALYAIMDGSEAEPLSKEERKLLFDYFNLCGEEYLFFQQGYLYPEVWEAWHNGMKIFRNNSRIQELWHKELKTYSYYGFRWVETPRCRTSQSNQPE